MPAPLVIPCYNRPAHLQRVLQALRPQAPEVTLVFADGPRGVADEGSVAAVRTLLAQNVHWPGLTALYHMPVNMGMRANVVNAVNMALTAHESAIILEDDCLPGPCFMAFMQAALTRYASNPLVMSVGAYTPPLPESLLATYEYDVYFLPRIETWGWATWGRAWAFYEQDYTRAWAGCQQDGIDLGTCGKDVPRNIQAHLAGRLNGWSPGWLMAVYRRGYCVYPTRSHVLNIGCDGSGDCPPSNRYGVSLAQDVPQRWPDAPFLDARIVTAVREFYG